MSSSITRRIESDHGLTGLFDLLANKLPASDLQSLLLDIYQTRSQAPALSGKVSGLLSQADRGGLLAPSGVEARLFHAFDGAAFTAAAGFEAVDLSPVSPFGASFALGGTSQNNVLTAVRNVEALGDSTIALAILSALRRRRSTGDGQVLRVCASHRVIRLQPVDVPGFTPHFRLFSMVSAGRDTGSYRFELEQLRQHVEAYLRLFERLNEIGFAMTDPLIEFADMTVVEAMLAEAGIRREEVREGIRAHKLGGTDRFLKERGVTLPSDVHDPGPGSLAVLNDEVVRPLRRAYPKAEFRINLARLEGLGYYRGFTLRISPRAPDGIRYPVADGGFTDWTARLLSNRKERLLISGIGSEFVCKKYRC